MISGGGGELINNIIIMGKGPERGFRMVTVYRLGLIDVNVLL